MLTKHELIRFVCVCRFQNCDAVVGLKCKHVCFDE